MFPLCRRTVPYCFFSFFLALFAGPVTGILIRAFSVRADQNLRYCSAGILVRRTIITSDIGLTPVIKGGRVMIEFFVNYSTVAFLLHLPTQKRQQFFGAVPNSLGKISYFPLPLDVRRCVAPTGEEVDARQRGVN